MALDQAYLSGIQTGEGIAEVGVNAFERARAWKNKLALQAEQHEDAAKALKTQAARFAESMGLKAEEAGEKKAEAAREDSETVRHNKAMEALQTIIHPPKAGAGSGMTPYQKTEAVSRASKNYLSAKNLNDQNGMTMYGKQLTDLGVPLPNAPVADKLGLMHPINDAVAAGKWLGGLLPGSAGASQPLTGGKALPGLE